MKGNKRSKNITDADTGKNWLFANDVVSEPMEKKKLLPGIR